MIDIRNSLHTYGISYYKMFFHTYQNNEMFIHKSLVMKPNNKHVTQLRIYEMRLIMQNMIKPCHKVFFHKSPIAVM